jgi:hypothetical protein
MVAFSHFNDSARPAPEAFGLSRAILSGENAGEQVSPVIARGGRRVVVACISGEAGFWLKMIPQGGKYRNFNLKTGIMVYYWAVLTSDFKITAGRYPGSQGRVCSDFFPDYEFCTNMPPTRQSNVPHLMWINLICYMAWSEP